MCDMASSRRAGQRKQVRQQRLMKHIGFTERDLDNIADWQPVMRRPPRRLSYGQKKLINYASSIILVIGAAVVSNIISVEIFALVALSVLIFLFILPFGAVRVADYAAYLRSKSADVRVESVEGILTHSPGRVLRTERGRYSTRSFYDIPDVFQITVGDMTFDVSENVYDAFESGLPYRLYFTAGSRTLVAAEVLLPD